MAQKRVDLWRASPESHKRLERRPAAAPREDLVPESRPCRRRPDALFLEQGVGVRREDFGPFVTVVTGRVAAVENVRKAFDEPIVVGSRNDGDLASNRGEQRFGTFPRCMRFGIVFGME